MIPSKVKKVYNDIKSLKIQGATAVAEAGLRAVEGLSGKDFTESIAYLKKARPDEPLMFNGFKFIKKVGTADEFLELHKKIKEEMIKIGAKRIPKGTIMTHCHSTTVVNILKKAHDHKNINVIVSETRPFYQGRITATELAKAGISVTFIVDSAQHLFVNKADLIIIGADVLTSDSHLINKVGTSQLAALAKESETEFCSACTLLKLDPETLAGEIEPIEQRNTKEVWKNPPKGIKIKNPAFDITEPHLIDFLITSEGVINPYNALTIAEEKYGWMFK